MTTPERISPMEVHDALERDTDALLVCAYDSEDLFEENHLEGAISLDAFEARLHSILSDREIVFYCTCPQEATAAGRAEEYMDRGYTNVKVLDGGVRAWKECGLPVVVAAA
ncbi:MAG: rhodanese-like domain-containing protein [Pirellulales bacterium]